MDVTIVELIILLFTLQNMLALLIGTVVGMVVGALPGLTAVMAIALLIPFTFGMPPATGILMLMAVYKAAIYGGSISAILLHTPGTPASAATALDGYPLTQQGKANVALRMSLIASSIGGLISAVALITLAPPLSLIALRFGPPEYFLLAIFGLTVIGSLASGSILKGLMAGGFGLLIGTVGVDMNVGYPRFDFGFYQLQGGISLVPALIGLFSLSQVLILIESIYDKKQKKSASIDLKSIQVGRVLPTFAEFKSELKETWKIMIRSSIIGIFIGILPGAGADIGSWVGYNEAKRFSKKPELFGKGSLEGIAASEAANNAVAGGAMIPTLTLGIPGSSAAAVLMGGLMIHGLIPGRELFTTHAEITYTAMLGFAVGHILMCILGFVAIKYALLVTRVSEEVLVPVIIVLCVIGAYAINMHFFDVWMMLLFGFLGYFLRKNGFHAAPVVLGMILGRMAEIRFTQSTVLADGNILGYILMRPISVAIILIILLTLVWPMISKKKNRTIPQADEE